MEGSCHCGIPNLAKGNSTPPNNPFGLYGEGDVCEDDVKGLEGASGGDIDVDTVIDEELEVGRFQVCTTTFLLYGGDAAPMLYFGWATLMGKGLTIVARREYGS